MEEDQDALSLEQIEGKDWGDPPSDATLLVATVHRLRRLPLGSLDAEGLRLLISQQVSVEVLVPRAIAALETDPLLEGDYYPGDVLAAVLRRVPADYWAAHPAELSRLTQVIASIEEPDPELKTDIDAFRTATGR